VPFVSNHAPPITIDLPRVQFGGIAGLIGLTDQYVQGGRNFTATGFALRFGAFIVLALFLCGKAANELLARRRSGFFYCHLALPNLPHQRTDAVCRKEPGYNCSEPR